MDLHAAAVVVSHQVIDGPAHVFVAALLARLVLVDLLRDEIEDCLEKRQRVVLENLRDLRGQQRAGLGLDRGDDRGPQQVRRDRRAVLLPVRIGAEIGELCWRGWPVLDDVVGAATQGASRCCDLGPDRRGTIRRAAGNR